jgi:DnaJ-class molecular chaperone
MLHFNDPRYSWTECSKCNGDGFLPSYDEDGEIVPSDCPACKGAGGTYLTNNERIANKKIQRLDDSDEPAEPSGF